MGKKVIQITEDKLHDIVKESTLAVVNSMAPLFSTHNISERNLIVEMARINKNENGKCIFPYDSWEIRIWGNDHNPPHFHVIRDGWDVEFLIETGELYRIKSEGRNKQIYKYILSNIKNWLNSTCFAQKKITNQENAMLHWESMHDE